MIEIIETRIIADQLGNDVSRLATISISDEDNAYEWRVGGLPLVGDLQPILDAREAELLPKAIAKGVLFDVFDLRLKAIAKKLALVMMDEINAVRNELALPLRTEAQLRQAIKNR